MMHLPILNHARSFALAVAVAGIVTGCSTPGMALAKKKTAPAISKRSIAIYTLKTVNQLRPTWQPEVKKIEVRSEAKGAKFKFKAPKAHAAPKDQYYEYLISVALPPGNYLLGNVIGKSSALLASARFRFPVDAQFTLPAQSVTYLGHVQMVNRERKEGERRSGPVLPLIDQRVSGFSNGTFDITLQDPMALSRTDPPLLR